MSTPQKNDYNTNRNTYGQEYCWGCSALFIKTHHRMHFCCTSCKKIKERNRAMANRKKAKSVPTKEAATDKKIEELANGIDGMSITEIAYFLGWNRTKTQQTLDTALDKLSLDRKVHQLYEELD